MSCSEGAASSRPSTLHLHGSKREACDRCRGQKLRCLRENQSQGSLPVTCVRCSKAGAICSYGIAKRAGRSRGSNAPPFQERRGNAGGKPKKAGIASRPTVNASGQSGFLDSKADEWQDHRGTGDRGSSLSLGLYPADQASEMETEDTTTVHTLSPLPLDDNSNIFNGVDLDFPTFSSSSSTTVPRPDKMLPPFSNNDTGEASSLDPFGFQYSWDFHPYQARPMGIQIPTASANGSDEQSRDVGANAYEIPAQICTTSEEISEASDKAIDLDLPGTSAYTAPFSPTKTPNARPGQARDRKRGRARISESMDISPTVNSALCKTLAETDAKIKVNEKEKIYLVKKIQHRHMQELSELTTNLYAQFAANDPENHQPMSGASATKFQDQFIGSVLKSANTFLTLLISFSTPAESSSDSGASPSASAMDYDDPTIDEPVQHPYHKLSYSSSDDSKPFPPIDMTTVLQLLSCYMRITHLYSIMYARILDYMLAFLQHTTQRIDSVPPIFPNMQVGGVSLNNFGTFQIKMLLQISVHILGEIESALGLPEEYRVGKRKGGEGVLGPSVSEGFLKCLMREGAWRGNKVECVREQLDKLRRVVKGAVDLQ